MIASRRDVLQGMGCVAAAAVVLSVAPSFAADSGAESADLPPLAFRELAPGVWMHTSWERLSNAMVFPSNGLIVKGKDRVLIVDTTWRTAEMPALLAEARKLGGGLPLQLVVSHAHEDRMSGLDIARKAGVRSHAHALTQADAPARKLPVADETWEAQTKRFDLGGRAVEVFHPGAAHTRDNVVVFIEDAGVLFGTCMIRPADGKALGNLSDADTAAWPVSMERVIAKYGKRARVVVPGHGEPGGPELLTHTLELARAGK